MSLGDTGVTAYGIVLISHPYYEDDIERCRGVVEEFRHNGLHTYNNMHTYISKYIFNHKGDTVINDPEGW